MKGSPPSWQPSLFCSASVALSCQSGVPLSPWAAVPGAGAADRALWCLALDTWLAFVAGQACGSASKEVQKAQLG